MPYLSPALSGSPGRIVLSHSLVEVSRHESSYHLPTGLGRTTDLAIRSFICSLFVPRRLPPGWIFQVVSEETGIAQSGYQERSEQAS
jgi:hypothetical protein